MAGWRCGCLFAEPLPTVHKRQLRFTQGAGISPSTQEALDWSGRRHRAVCGPLDGLSIPPLAGEHGHLGNEPILLAQKLGCVVASPRQRSLSLRHAPTMCMPRLGVVDRVRECAPTLCAVADFYQLEMKSLSAGYMQRNGCVACKGLFNQTEQSAAIWHRFFVNTTRDKHRETVFLSEAKLSKQVVRLLESARPCPRAHVTYRKKIIDKARSCAAFHKLPGPLISNAGLSEYCGSSMTRMLSLMLRCACAQHQLGPCRAHSCEHPVAGSSTSTLHSSVLTSPLPTTSTRHCQRTVMSEKELLLSRAWRQASRRTCTTPACTRQLAVGCTTSSSN
jgi:hypothetical protein